MSMSKTARKTGLSILALIVLSSMVSLGFWQLHRAHEKQVMQNELNQRQSVQLNLNTQAADVSDRFSQASMSGRYLAKHTALLDNQVHSGQVGYHVLTPFQIDDSGLIILVNRGWVPVGESRQQKPLITTPDTTLSLLGRLNLPLSKPVFWDDELSPVQEGAWQYLDLLHYQQINKLKILPLLLELDKTLDRAGGYVRQWRTYDDQWVERHRAYAFQWFSMAVVFLIMCVYVYRKTRFESVSEQNV